jgi:pyridoxamine 5'-phosphate oxidase
MTQHPIEIFKEWYGHALESSPLQHPKAVCISTIDKNGFPEARFVALKDVSEKGFTFCSALDSAKGISIDANPIVALTFWWDHIERQVRVQGKALRISDAEADQFFRERPRDAQLTSLASKQSTILENPEGLEQKLQELDTQFEGRSIPRPKKWSGYHINPSRIEFLKFQENRLHERTLFIYNDNDWTSCLLQP